MDRQVQSSKPWVLVVEDDESLSDLLAARLETAGYRVLRSAKAYEAIRMLGNQRFDAILTDLQLEVGDGLQVIKGARKNETSPNFLTPIVLMSGQLNEVVLKASGKQIAFAVVKPFDIEALVARLDRLCNRVSNTAASAS